MRHLRLAKRYAKAFFELSEEVGQIETVCSDIRLINQTFADNKDLRFVISNPVIRKDKKSAIVKEIFEKQINDLTMRYLQLILKKGRELQIDLICLEFYELYKQYKNIVSLEIESAQKLDRDTVEMLKSKVEAATHSIVEIKEILLPNLIGGVRLRFSDYLLDASVKGSIKQLRKELVDKSYQINF
ncbi:MAG: ATP synthase F1 subunit delta [Bacteroidales bacterium]|jgi:F-type H+-transporting ATPase subunit delta|nr:ATP synthase F1 subunit delta [Bacteroidales bacterium]